MTSESEALKTNEFLRRRKLRLQQVREQSKDIAKKLRQRSNAEKLQQIVDLDSKKEKDYLYHQGKLVKHLEQLYAQGVKSVGASHIKASEVKQNASSPEKVDLSKSRGKEAVAELRRRKQEKLDEQKKLLDRKLWAREAANEKSREKSTNIANKLLDKPSTSKATGPDKLTDQAADILNEKDQSTFDPKTNKNDMATQWDLEEMPSEWEPNIPTLSLPNDDKESVKNSDNVAESKSDKSKRLDLFALSSEMPSSLRGGRSNILEEQAQLKPSLTAVSEYLQNRALRLRETDTTSSNKKHSDDLQGLRQTILRSRTSKLEGTINTIPKHVCQVLDEQVIPVPMWRAESSCQFCSHGIMYHSEAKKCSDFSVTNSEINKIFSAIRPTYRDIRPTPVIRGCSPFRRNIYPNACQVAAKHTRKSVISSEAETILSKKNSVTTYNHSTRNVKDIPCSEAGLVIRDHPSEEDAYSQALKEMSMDNIKKNKHQNKLQELRNKVAVTKQTVEKEYNDTMSFLKSFPKEKCSKHVRNAHMDERRQQMQKDRRQQKLQQEFRKIEKECQRDCAKSVGQKQTTSEKYQKKPKSPVKLDIDDNDFNSRDLQYFWMPVPESDGNLAIHTIPTTLKEGKSGNTVKFSKVDSYHEYRSRHKHTPPTKETSEDRQSNRKVVETILIHKGDSESTDNSSISSDTSSVENLNIEKKSDKEHVLSDADKIIIYKILDSKLGKKSKDRKSRKIFDNVAEVLSSIGNDKLSEFIKDINNNRNEKNAEKTEDNKATSIPIEQIKDGVYKMVNEKGLSYNVTSCFTANLDLWQTSASKPWWDNVSSFFHSNKHEEGHALTEDRLISKQCVCTCGEKISSDQKSHKGNEILSGSGDRLELRKPPCSSCRCGCEPNYQAKANTNSTAHHSTATSTSSFKTAATDRVRDAVPDSGYVKLLDDDGQDAGKFFIGASEFLKDNAYEVVIQLRKKETSIKDNNINVEDKPDLRELKESSDTLPDTSSKPNVKETTAGEEKLGIGVLKDEQMPERNVYIMHPNTQTNDMAMTLEKGQHLKKTTPCNSGEELKTIEKSAKVFVDRGENTSTQFSFAVPSDFPKTDPIPRPGTSTYTQTSISSPNPRPVFIHMSSSTSTAYMSPPELVLPSFLRQKYSDVKNDCDQFNMQDEKFEAMDHQNNNEEYRRRQCRRRVKNERIAKNVKRNITTPPNTTRATRKNKDFYDDLHCQIRNTAKKCRKCQSRTGFSSDKNVYKRTISMPSRNLVMHVSPSGASTFKNKIKNLRSDDKLRKSHLNPVIQKYVNRLLDLNKDGLKAIEVANQECSSVSTPGSSIIEVSRNINHSRTDIENKISLEQIKNILRKQILEEYVKENIVSNNNIMKSLYRHTKKSKICSANLPRVRSVHKVKSLNISRKLLNSKTDKQCPPSRNFKSNTSSPAPSRDTHIKKYNTVTNSTKSKERSKSTPTPRPSDYPKTEHKSESDKTRTVSRASNTSSKFKTEKGQEKEQEINKSKDLNFLYHKVITRSPDSDNTNFKSFNNDPTNTSTQTKQDIDSEINLIKIAEDKLQNMEKIADLTEKCTKRLSSLAKVLEEVRKNKSLAYSHISSSETASDSDHISDKNQDVTLQQQYEYQEIPKDFATAAPLPGGETGNFIPFLTDIPKPAELKHSTQEQFEIEMGNLKSPVNHVIDHSLGKSRGRPPPALSRINLKHRQDVIPHELSTVLEVDSPMSVRLKNVSSRSNTKCDVSETSYKSINNDKKEHAIVSEQDVITEKTDLVVNPDLLLSNISMAKRQLKMPPTDASDETKLKMMDLQQFNEVMLKPFISLQEYAKQCDVGVLDEGSNMDDNVKDDYNEELSSLHSDGSLPDVIAELLKRNIITEPFKFDSASNVNSTTVSSESTLSVLALSKIRKEKKKASVVFHNKENISETSDTLSMSSNPDLENAFKKMGMGWASSTLKKTKERLALSSSSNTSSSSLTQFKIKTFNNQDIPVLVSDSVSSATRTSKKPKQPKNSTDSAKNAEQQTSFINSMTVKEFLTNELGKKITFSNKSNRNNTDEEFVSLLETKMPEEMKLSAQDLPEAERSNDSYPSANNNRARTSTPVQIFKSMTYHSSSSSNMSNGLFSNADDLSSVKVTSNSIRNHSTSDKDDLTIPNCSLKTRKGATDSSKSD